NGWFGGFLPATVFAIVAATGNIYSGLWYPIAVAAMSFVVGLIFLPETKDRDITCLWRLAPALSVGPFVNFRLLFFPFFSLMERRCLASFVPLPPRRRPPETHPA